MQKLVQPLRCRVGHPLDLRQLIDRHHLSQEEAAAQLEEAVKLLRSVVKELRALEVRD